MRIKALENWEYVPEFAGNRKQKASEQTVYTFKLLSWAEDRELRNAGEPVFPDSFKHVVAMVKNPPILVSADGKETESAIDDMADKPELKGLFMELVVEYSKHATLERDAVKL